ncbi:RICIN domain-containing protein [Yinghuangia aomiensis]
MIILVPQSAGASPFVENHFTRVITGNWNCLDAEASQAGQNGGEIQQWECLAPGTAGPNQFWYIDRVTPGDDRFTVHNGATWGGKCLDADPGFERAVYLWDCNGAQWQEWYVITAGNGNTRFINRYWGSCLTVGPVTWPGNGGYVGLFPCRLETDSSGQSVPIMTQVFNSLIKGSRRRGAGRPSVDHPTLNIGRPAAFTPCRPRPRPSYSAPAEPPPPPPPRTHSPPATPARSPKSPPPRPTPSRPPRAFAPSRPPTAPPDPARRPAVATC